MIFILKIVTITLCRGRHVKLKEKEALMFRNKSKIKLTIAVTDHYKSDSDEVNGSFYSEGFDKYEVKISSLADLTELHESLVKSHHEAQVSKKIGHKISFIVNGTIEGAAVKDLKLNSLDKLHAFISEHSQKQHATKPSIMGILYTL
jgi:hypothetical protein